MNQASVQVLAPGKLILSGEHAVVYGQPALAMAVNRYVSVSVVPRSDTMIGFHFPDLRQHHSISQDQLTALYQRASQQYDKFQKGECSIKEVIQSPKELMQVTLALLLEATDVSPQGMDIQITSDIPVGCGMGSSAAAIVSLMSAVASLVKKSIPREQFFDLALAAENFQHGKSSGVDLHVAMRGGCLYVNQHDIESRQIPALSLYLVNTGTPVSTTGQCVERAANYFKSSSIGQSFADVTNAMDSALTQSSLMRLRDAIRENHRLLTKIEVVPQKTQAFIAAIEAQGGAAKICGAGAVSGDNAGMVMAVTDDPEALSMLCEQAGHEMMAVSAEPRGVYAI